ncbi:CYTH domain-containing protein [Hahella aquimaris]|uniref:CYTH domain-containing protein n=1 Tax=Hahella sp. HNIBRBA332 TaxID=3015983 RepID=UPI00273CDF4B|nr:CYTH domain-containing protein [Hahella sp. HNIBRBA332]WLQ12223.1 CYTH domain-containing protein [Hahella sp. HNIBRBA332]
MKEIEVKLSFPRKRLSRTYSDLIEIWGNPNSSSILQNVYYDTPNFAMQRSKIALRIRNHGDTWEQTLKGSGRCVAGLHVRDEWNWQLSENKLDITKLSKVEAVKGIELERVGPVFETKFERTKWMVEVGGSVFELALDIGEIRSAGGVQPISEIEIELKEGDVSCVIAVAEKIAKQVPCWLSKKSKAARGYSLAGVTATERECDPERIVSTLLDELIDELACYMEAAANDDGKDWYQYVECMAGISSLLTLSGSKGNMMGQLVKAEVESLFQWLSREQGVGFSEYILNSTAPGLIGLEVLRRELTG